jgi:succinoglycan biosynthesis protein ExoO
MNDTAVSIRPDREPAERAKPVLLVVSREMLQNLDMGHAVYVRVLLAKLRRDYRIALVVPSYRSLARGPFKRLALDETAFDEIYLSGGPRLGRWLIRADAKVWAAAIAAKIRKVFAALTGRRDPGIETWERFWDAGLADDAELAAVRKAVACTKPAAVLVNHFFMAPCLDLPELRRIPKILIAHDIFFERNESFARAGQAPSYVPVPRERELAELRKPDLLLAIQDSEAARLRELLPGREVMTVGISFPVRPAPRAPEPDTVLFVGSDTDANADGLKWFLGRVWPKVRALRPSARLRVCGGVADHVTQSVEGVTPVGRVPDLTPEFHRAALCVVPLRIGSGLKIKLVDALCHGCALVTTSVGAQGLERLSGTAFLETDDADAFARDCAAILRDPRRRTALSESALAAACDRFSDDAVYGPLRGWLGKSLRS